MKSAIIIASLGLASVLSFGANAAVNQVNAEPGAKFTVHGHRFRFSGRQRTDGYASGAGG